MDWHVRILLWTGIAPHYGFPLSLSNLRDSDVKSFGELHSVLWALVVVGIRVGLANNNTIVVICINSTSTEKSDTDKV